MCWECWTLSMVSYVNFSSSIKKLKCPSRMPQTPYTLNMKHPIAAGSVVATTGSFNLLSQPRSWIQTRGATYVVWSPRLTHLLVGSDYNPQGWKYQQVTASNGRIRILHESELPTPPKDLWVDRYKPKTLADVIGHAAIVKDLKTWLAKWPNATAGRAALLTGPPGIGKTTVAHLLAKEAGYSITEYNASDERSAKAIREIFEKMAKLAALPTTTAAQPRRLLILDEVAGMSAGDRGGVAEIAKWIREGGCAFPILCLANDRSSPKLKGLATLCFDCRFSRPQKGTIAKAVVAKLKEAEGLRLSVSEVEDICERSGNDIRSILNSLQFASSSSSVHGCADMTGAKDEVLRMDPFSATGRLFGTVATLAEREQAAFVDTGFVPLMVHEGYLGAADKCRGGKEAGLEAAVQAAEALTMWDVLDTRIHRQQAWGLLPAASMAVVTAAKAANGPPPFQIFPQWLGKQSKKGKHQRLLQDMQGRMRGGGASGSTGSSLSRNLLDERSVLRAQLFAKDATIPNTCAKLAALGMTRDDMLETLVETVFKGDEADVAMETKKKSALTREWKKLHPLAADTSKETKGKKRVDDEDEDDVGDPDSEED